MAPIKEFSSADLNTISRLSGVSNVLVKVNGATVAASSFSGLLDTYTGAAAAYSTRRLNSQYTGAAMRVREDSGDTETDIGFDANGNLLTADIATHCGSANGYVTKWYDQAASGGTGSGNDAEQSTHGSQPQIYNGSAVITDNGKPAILGGWFENVSGITLASTWSSFEVYKSVSGDTDFITYGGGTSQQFGLIAYSGLTGHTAIYRSFGSPSFYIDGNSAIPSGTSMDGVYQAVATGSTILLSVTGGRTDQWSAFYTRNSNNGTYIFEGYMQEQIFFGSDQSSNRSGIEGNINAHFQIGNFGTPTSGLLSTYTGAAAAYSVRQLANTAALCMRVRRDNDDAEQDFGFDANGDLDTAAIATFVGSGNNGYVSKWYDQSGNGKDADQSTNGSQPQIYNGSAVITLNGKPVVSSVSGAKMDTNMTNLDFKFFCVNKAVSPAVMFGHTSNQYWLLATNGSGSLMGNFSVDSMRLNGASYTVPATRALLYADLDEQNLLHGDINMTSYNVNNLFIGYTQSVAYPMYDTQELIIYPDTSTHTASDIEANQNTYFSIY